MTGIATAETLIDCIEEGRCDETTSDDLPWVDDVNVTYGKCNGACCVDIQKVKYCLQVILVPPFVNPEMSPCTLGKIEKLE